MTRESNQNGAVRANQTTIGSSLIPLINKIQDIIAPLLINHNIPLPQVAVVGSQSSGKSSVIEALVGRDFLPRGGLDICTRRPLALSLENRRNGDDDSGGRELGQFRHLPGQIFYDFDKIRDEIQAETEREAGHNKGVSDKQIRLKISSPNVLNMTLIDLPGITKVAVGDQPSDIEARIRSMIMSYICQENCIILAVTPANSDLAASDALQIAKEADPTGSRTIGVITKLDIMDKGTDARDLLLGRVIPLHLGYVGVMNRSQEDINFNRSIQEALRQEEQFFHDHPAYAGLSDRCGIPQLAKKLNQILEQHIRMTLPNLKAKLISQMDGFAKDLQIYGKPMESKAQQGVILLDILKRYCEAFTALVDGTSQEIFTKEISGGARIRHIFQSIFVKSLEDVKPCQGLTDGDIQVAIRNAAGLRNSLFVPEVPFEVLVRRQIEHLKDPSLQCLKFVHDELIKMSHSCKATELQRFPYLRRCIDVVMRKLLLDGVKPAKRMIQNLIAIEMDYINNSHPNFIGGKKAVELVMQQSSPSLQGSHLQSNYNRNVSPDDSSSRRSWGISSMFRKMTSSREDLDSRFLGETHHDAETSLSTMHLREPPSTLRPQEITEKEAVDISVMKLLVESYYNIVRKNIQDLVPKAIMHLLVNRTKKVHHNTLIQELYREDLYGELLQEDEEEVARRKYSVEVHYVLKQALQTLEAVEYEVSQRCSS